MKIAILTLPFHANYGGILQAYALQSFLKKTGYTVNHIQINNDNLIKRILKRTFPCFYFFLSKNNKKYKYIYRFIQKNIKVEEYNNFGLLNENSYNVYIVGSDQIWRSEYYKNIGEAYLDFAQAWNVKRIAYAISIGNCKLDYSDAQLRVCKNLIKKFDAISFRENILEQVFQTQFGSTSQIVLDPTLLLQKEDYRRFINVKIKSDLFAYFIDDTENNKSVYNIISKHFKLTYNITVGTLKNSYLSSVESWISYIVNSKFILTDSFHGIVFCLMFHKAFVVMPNMRTGSERIKSLLSRFNLQNRIVLSGNENEIINMYNSTIDWEYVDRLLAKERSLSANFLISNIE